MMIGGSVELLSSIWGIKMLDKSHQYQRTSGGAERGAEDDRSRDHRAGVCH